MKENEELQERLKQSLVTIEASSPNEKPSLNEMITQVKQTRQKQKRELYIFFIIALVFITGIVLLMANEPLLFAGFQIIAVVVGIGFLAIGRRLQHE